MIAELSTELGEIYRDYIASLNRRDWSNLHRFVQVDVRHNGRPLGLTGYRTMLERDVSEIPDLHFDIALLAVDPPHVAARLQFVCTPKASFLGLPVNGKRITFTENVFYAFDDRKIAEVWSIIDKAAIEAQLGRVFR